MYVQKQQYKEFKYASVLRVIHQQSLLQCIELTYSEPVPGRRNFPEEYCVVPIYPF